MPDVHKNAAYSLVATAPSPATSGTSLVCTAGEGARFPTGSFDLTVWPAGAQPIWDAGAATGGNFEICRATISTDTFTLTRAQYGTTARTIVVGDQIAVTVNAKTLTDIEGTAYTGPGPQSNKLLAYTFDPSTTDVQTILGKGIVYGCRMEVPGNILATNLLIDIFNTAGATLSNCFAALFDSAGNQLAISATQATAWQSAGVQTCAFTTPVNLLGGPGIYVYGALLVGNGSTTPPTITRSRNLNAALTNVGLVAADGFRTWQSGSTLTAMPATINITAATSQANLWWMGIS